MSASTGPSPRPAGVHRGVRAVAAGCLLLAVAIGFPPPGVASEPALVGGEPPQGAGLVPAAAPAGTGYRWPLAEPVEVLRPFDPPARRWHPGHRGVDLAATGDEVVRAAGDGVVRFAGPVVDRGVVSIDHPDGLRTTYEPVTPTVSAGDRVAAGDPIGVVTTGHAGCPVETCLHWGVRQGEFYLDPLALLGLGRSRLLPMVTP